MKPNKKNLGGLKPIFWLTPVVAVILILSLFQQLKPQEKSLQYDIRNLPSNQEPVISFLAFGDSGTGGAPQKKLAETMLSYPFDFIIHTGDLAYPTGSYLNYKNNFFDIYEKHMERGPIYPSPGNHDYLPDKPQTYLKIFDLPKQALNAKDQGRYYSFDTKFVHFISLDTNDPLAEISSERNDDMADWLENDLKKVSADKWKIVFFHHPPFSSGIVHGDNEQVNKLLVPIFEKHNVDLVFSGHEHDYERTCSIKAGRCADKGVIYIVTGGGGQNLYDFGDKKYFTVRRSVVHHFVSAVVSKCLFETQVVDINNNVIDGFSINKCDR